MPKKCAFRAGLLSARRLSNSGCTTPDPLFRHGARGLDNGPTSGISRRPEVDDVKKRRPWARGLFDEQIIWEMICEEFPCEPVFYIRHIKAREFCPRALVTLAAQSNRKVWYFFKVHLIKPSKNGFCRNKIRAPLSGSSYIFRHRAIFPGLKPKYCNRSWA